MNSPAYSLPRRLAAEAIGTAVLLAVIVGSGIMGERLAGGNTALALLANSLATGAGLYALIATLAPVSGAHFNPLVTLAEWGNGRMDARATLSFIAVQLAAAALGVVVANAMFDLPLTSPSQHVRSGFPQWLSESVATFGLMTVILLGARTRAASVPAMVAGYITAAYWFTASTAFANPAVTIARTLSDTFAGIRSADAPLFIVAQCVGAAAAFLACRWLLQAKSENRH